MNGTKSPCAQTPSPLNFQAFGAFRVCLLPLQRMVTFNHNPPITYAPQRPFGPTFSWILSSPSHPCPSSSFRQLPRQKNTNIYGQRRELCEPYWLLLSLHHYIYDSQIKYAHVQQLPSPAHGLVLTWSSVVYFSNLILMVAQYAPPFISSFFIPKSTKAGLLLF